jgi:hypothetical protein
MMLLLGSCSAAGDLPPDLVVTAGTAELTLEAWAYCFSPEGGEDVPGNCTEGSSPQPPPPITLEAGENLSVQFPLSWHIDIEVTPATGPCGDAWVSSADPEGSPVEQLGPAGTYVANVRGTGPEGDAWWTFGLTTSEDHGRPDPFAEAGWILPNEGLTAEASFRARIANVAPPPSSVSPMVSVVAADGASGEFTLQEIESGDYCWDGSIDVRAPADFAGQVLDLGPAPYNITVFAQVDGSLWTADPVRWPEDFANGLSDRVAVTVSN